MRSRSRAHRRRWGARFAARRIRDRSLGLGPPRGWPARRRRPGECRPHERERVRERSELRLRHHLEQLGEVTSERSIDAAKQRRTVLGEQQVLPPPVGTRRTAFDPSCLSKSGEQLGDGRAGNAGALREVSRAEWLLSDGLERLVLGDRHARFQLTQEPLGPARDQRRDRKKRAGGRPGRRGLGSSRAGRQ